MSARAPSSDVHLFAIDEHFIRCLEKSFAGTLCLGTVRKSAVDAQRAINGQNIHRIISRNDSSLSKGKAGCPVSFRKIIGPVDAVLGVTVKSTKGRRLSAR